jgi:uncharacterized membrane protein YhiD involved in acid resistance
MDIFDIQDMTAEFSILDVVLVLALSFLLSAFIGWIYKISHRGASYSQSFVFTLVLNGMLVALVMTIVGSNLARAFTLIGALSIIRFRNALKETRDIGFIFFTMAIGMAVGTRFYLLAVIATVVISLVSLLMTRLNWFARTMSSQILRIQVANDAPFDTLFNKVLGKHTTSYELISVDSVRNGMLTELTYSIGLRRPDQIQEFITELRNLNGHNRVTLTAGYNGTDL